MCLFIYAIEINYLFNFYRYKILIRGGMESLNAEKSYISNQYKIASISYGLFFGIIGVVLNSIEPFKACKKFFSYLIKKSFWKNFGKTLKALNAKIQYKFSSEASTYL